MDGMAKEQAARFRIEALDKASAVMNRVNNKLGRMSKQVKGLGKSMTFTLTAPVVAGLGVSLKAFDTQEKALAQVKTAIESTGNAAKISFEDLQKEASRLQSKSLFGDEDILANVTAQLQTFTNVAGDEFKRTQQAALDLATRLDGDLKSASIQLGKALNDPVANLSALSRSGIQFSKSQKQVINDLVKSGKLAEAQGLILDELEKQYGGAAEAASKAGLGPMKQIANRLADFSERIGKALLPVIEKVGPVVDRVVARLEGMSDGMVATGVAIAGVAAAAGPALLVLGGIISAAGTLAGAFSTVAAVIGGVSFAPVLVAVAAVTVAFTALKVVFDELDLSLGDFSGGLTGAADKIKVVLAGVQGFAKGMAVGIKLLGAGVAGVINSIVGGVKVAMASMGGFFSEVGTGFSLLKQDGLILWENLKAAGVGAAGVARLAWAGMLDFVSGKIGNILIEAGKGVAQIPGLADLGQDIGTTGGDLAYGTNYTAQVEKANAAVMASQAGVIAGLQEERAAIVENGNLRAQVWEQAGAAAAKLQEQTAKNIQDEVTAALGARNEGPGPAEVVKEAMQQQAQETRQLAAAQSQFAQEYSQIMRASGEQTTRTALEASRFAGATVSQLRVINGALTAQAAYMQAMNIPHK